MSWQFNGIAYEETYPEVDWPARRRPKWPAWWRAFVLSIAIWWDRASGARNRRRYRAWVQERIRMLNDGLLACSMAKEDCQGVEWVRWHNLEYRIRLELMMVCMNHPDIVSEVNV